jgi:hypothetical protein
MFRVAWMQTALNDLAQAWMQADSGQRAAITIATQAVDQILQNDPQTQGESRCGGQRLLLHPPLGVVFEVEPRLSSVRVVHAWVFRRRQQKD